jgi:replicative DNA helicase
MAPELSIIRLFQNYKIWEQYRDKLEVQDFPKELQPIYSVLDNFHNKNEEQADLSVADLGNLLVSSSIRDKDYYLGVLEQLQKLEVSADTTVTLVQSILRNKQLGELSLAAHDAKEGRIDHEKVNELIDKFRSDIPVEEEPEEDLFASDDLVFLVNTTLKKQGLRWRLKTLNEMLGSLRQGDFGFVFARPETGKTTFLASEVTFMASQLDDDAGPILWINNEEQSEKVSLRCIQAATGASLPELYSQLDKYNQMYKEITKSKIKIIKGLSIIHRRQVEKWCKKFKPSLIIFDQIDKIVGFENDREDLKLGAIYQWARELAKQWAPVIAICQADASGEGTKWLTMNNVANAKTSKQAEADWILGIGCIHEAGWESIRFLHLSKNKLTGDEDTDPKQRHGKREVLIDPYIERYKDLPKQ